MSVPLISLALSLLAVGISGLALYLTYFRRGRIRMTQPAAIFFGPDENGSPTANHHFLLPAQETGFQFRPGDYELEVHARRVRDDSSHVLARATLSVTVADADHITHGNGGVYFDWGPESGRYHSHLDTKSAVKKYSDADLAAIMNAMAGALERKAPDPDAG